MFKSQIKNFRKQKIHLSPIQVTLLGFLGAIIVGCFLLMLPICTADHTPAPFFTALYTATSAVCVNGIVPNPTATYWSFWGQLVIMLLFQLGGLGIVTFSIGFLYVFYGRISLSNKLLLETAFNLDKLNGPDLFLRRVFKGTVFCEIIGAFLFLPVFCKDYGVKGIWISIFHSVSSFCNAGFDILGNNSLAEYASNIWLNVVTMLLVVIGGLGFVVWWDLFTLYKIKRKNNTTWRKSLHLMKLHTKITIITTFVLIVFGAVVFTLSEWTNPNTLGQFEPHIRVMAGLFQSITTRTAGFCTIPQNRLTDNSVLTTVILMFIGGSSVSTAGGVKTTTIAVLILCALSVSKGSEYTTAHGRTIPATLVRRALAIFVVSISTMLAAMLLFGFLENQSFANIVFDTVSVLSTTGLSRGMVDHLCPASQVLLLVCMYLGRVGPISLAIAFASRLNKDKFQYPSQDITLG